MEDIPHIGRNDEPVLDAESSRHITTDIYTQGDRQGGQDHHRNAESVQVIGACAFESTDLNGAAHFAFVEGHYALWTASRGMTNKKSSSAWK
jgi:hypothetical protein